MGRDVLTNTVEEFFSWIQPDVQHVTGMMKYSLLVILVVWNIGRVFRWGFRSTSKFRVRAGRSGV